MKLFQSPKIVKISDYYAIEKIFLGFKSYKDLSIPYFWFGRSSPCFRECISEDLNRVTKYWEIHHGEAK